MKKLLALLSSLSLISTSATITVSCNKYEQTNSDGDSILVNFLEQIGGDGISTISASDVLYKLVSESNASSRQTFVNDFTNLLDISFLAGSNDGGVLNGLYKNTDSPYYSSTLIKSMQQAFASINSSADSQIERERATYKSDYGWRWNSKWRDYLAGKFPLYQSQSKYADVSFLEKKYKSSLILTSADYSAAATLQKFLLNTDQFGVTWVEPDEIRTKLQSFAIAGDKDQWVTDNKDAATQIWNSQYTDVTNWVTSSNENVTAANISGTFISDDGNIKTDSIKCAVPSDISQFTSSDSVYRTGYLSNTQKYFAEKWYETKAPIATSYIKFPFATNASFDKGITRDSFAGLNDVEANEITKFFNTVFPKQKSGEISETDEKDKPDHDDNNNPTADNNWKTIMSNAADISKSYADATATVNSSLLTLSNSSDYEQDVRSAIYDYVFSLKNGGGVASKNTNEIDPTISTLSNTLGGDKTDFMSTMLEKIERTLPGAGSKPDDTSEKMYATIKGAAGFIVMVTSNGLMIYHIDGYKQLSTSIKVTDQTEHPSKSINDGQIDSKTLQELQAFKKFSDMSDLEKVQSIQIDPDKNTTGSATSDDEPKTDTSTYGLLNRSVANPYLKWLLNNSLLASVSGSATKFDLMKTVKTWANQTDSPSTTGEYEWTTYIIDYFKNIIVDENGNQYSNADFIAKFIQFSSDDGSETSKNLAKSLGSWYANALDSIDSVIASNSSQSFIKAYIAWKKTITQKTDDAYPKATLEQDAFDESNLSTIVGKMWWMPTTKTSGTSE